MGSTVGFVELDVTDMGPLGALQEILAYTVVYQCSITV